MYIHCNTIFQYSNILLQFMLIYDWWIYRLIQMITSAGIDKGWFTVGNNSITFMYILEDMYPGFDPLHDIQ
jgi:hypothetical protein